MDYQVPHLFLDLLDVARLFELWHGGKLDEALDRAPLEELLSVFLVAMYLQLSLELTVEITKEADTSWHA